MASEQKRQKLHLENFDGFSVDEVLMNDPKSKRIHVLGKFRDSDDKAIVIMVKSAFSNELIGNILSSDTKLSEEFQNDIYAKHSAYTKESNNVICTQIIKPATEKHILKYKSQEPYLIFETSDDYIETTKPYLEKSSFSIDWVYNILDHKAETERIVFEDPHKETGFVLLPDLKWDTKQLEDLYVLAICHCRDIRSIRELNGKHLPLLKNILNKGMEEIKKAYGVPATKIRAYLHYYPSFYHLHVHFNHILYDIGGVNIEKAHLLNDVIDNIEVSSDYYAKKTLAVKLYKNDTLLSLLMKEKTD